MKAQFDMKDETVNGIELHLNPTEALVFLCALHKFSNSTENAEIDRRTATKMIDTYSKSLAYQVAHKGGQ